ncbi:MAG: hypothetical protein HS124_03820 [Anaerolineales bacterium]|nr:hypothetical protein [Anaerolineales bacterium]MCL4259599.1 hypothetical protein [Anaerolineales bacterium]
MHTVEVPIKDAKNPPKIIFPDRCVNCGKPKHVVMPMKLIMGVEKRGQGVLMDFPVPLCAECEKKEQRITYVTLVPFLIAGLVLGVIAFIPAMLIAPEGTSQQTLGFPFVFGGLVGMVVGAIGGTVVEFVLKLLLAPVYGQLLLKRPLTILSFFNDSENVIGLSARFTDKKKSLKLIFENDVIGKEFKQLNL